LIQAAGLLRSAGYANFSIDLYGKVTDPAFPALVRELDVDGHVPLLRNVLARGFTGAVRRP